MNKADLAMLGRAFDAEVRGALSRSGITLFQTRSKRALALAERGYLELREVQLGGRFAVTVKGFALTELGRIAYCETIDSDSEDA